MTDLQVRKLAFSFEEHTPFQWNPANPAFGVSFNGFTFIAPAFERYMVAATRMAKAEITDPDVLAEADAFLRQEATHARADRNHAVALTSQYPGLAEVSNEELDRRFATLLATHTLPYTPMFDLMLRHKAHLFDNGDPGVAPLFLWHLVEEIEHRSSAQMVYDAVVPSPWYRLRVAAERTPPFADEWLAAYDRGHDVVHWYDVVAEGGP